MADKIVEPIEGYGIGNNSGKKRKFAKVGLVGCGTAGRRLAIQIASKGMEVIFVEVDQAHVDEAISSINSQTDKLIASYDMTDGDKRGIMSRIVGTLDFNILKDCDLVIESIFIKDRTKRVGLRTQIFKKIEEIVSQDAIIATNSMAMLMTDFISDLKHKERCLDINIPTVANGVGVVEVAKSVITSKQTCENIELFCKMLGKKLVYVEDAPGLISARLLAPFINLASQMVMEGTTTAADVDTAMRGTLNMPFGPLELADSIGLDCVLRWLDNLHDEYGDPCYKASGMIKKLVRNEMLGKKSGVGFYYYDKPSNI